MNPIFAALGQGHNPQQILNYLIRAVPGLAKPISKATAQGHSIKSILGFLSKNFDTEDRRGMSESQRHAANKRADTERTKYGLTAAIGIVAAPLASKAIGNLIGRSFPSNIQLLPSGVATQQTTNVPSQTLGQNIAPQIQQTIPQQGQPPTQNLIPASQQPPVANVQNNLQNTQSQAPIIQNQPQQSQVNVSEILNNLKSKLKVDDLIKLDWSPEQIKAYFTKFHPDVIKNAEKLSGTTFEDIIGQYIQEEKTKQSVPEIPEESNAPIENTLIEEEKLQPKVVPIEKVTSEEVIEPEPVKKQDIVVVPQGVGEVREIRNGKAIVEIDGKLHKVDESEIEEPPLPRKEMADLYEDLKNEIESQTGEEVSRHVTFLGYDPNSKQLIYMPWRGQPYTYNDVTDEEIANLRDKINRKTSGENFIGAYQEGTESPIGAAMSEFIQRRKAQQKEKGIEKKEPIHKAKFEKLYYAYEPAEKAAEARYKERKKQTKKNTRVPKSNV